MSAAQQVTNTHEPVVYVIDDDAGVRKSVQRVMESVGLAVVTFSSADEFLDSCPPSPLGCIITDLRMPRMGGLELHKTLQDKGVHIPVIFMTAFADVKTGVRAMKQGGFDFIEKPFNNQELIELVHQAIDKSVAASENLHHAQEVSTVLASLSEQERKVLDGIMDGKLNKTIADELNLSDKTIEYHRAKVMKKFSAGSVAELVKSVCSAKVH